MEKLKSYLITRLLLLLAAVIAAESGVCFLVVRFLLPFAAIRAQYEGDLNISGFSDLLRIMRELLAVSIGQGSPNLSSRSAVLLLLAVSLVLFALPVVLGVLWYAGKVGSRIDRLDKEREEERKKADEQRSLMLSDFAHDLRTPVMTISGYAGALADGMVKDERQRQEYLEAIRKKSDHMGRLISTLFDYTKLNSVHFHMERERTDLNELLRESVGDVYSDFEQAGAEILTEIPEEPFYVEADRIQAARVFQNLLVNVIRHNPPGTEAAVSVRRLAGMEQIAFADTGVRIGKSAEELFEPFVKDDDARSSSAGSGLGLSIAKKIADMHGWEIRLEQPFGRYTKAFILRVPER